MELPIDSLEQRIHGLENELRFWSEVLQKSEKYERLKDNEDWLDVLKEVQHVADVHETEINNARARLTDVRPKDREEVFDIILVHQMRLEQIKEALGTPNRVLGMAKQARDRIPEIKSRLVELQREVANA